MKVVIENQYNNHYVKHPIELSKTNQLYFIIIKVINHVFILYWNQKKIMRFCQCLL